MVIESLIPPDVTVSNPDGYTVDNKPYIDYSTLLGDENFDPSETSSLRRVIFNNPQRLRFNFTTKILVKEEAQVTLESLYVEPESTIFATAGNTQQLTVTGTYSDGTEEDLTAASTGTVYTSDNPDVATVSQDGLVTAGTSNGTAIITASNGGISGSATVEVSIDIDIVPPDIQITMPPDGAVLTNPQVTISGTIQDESPIQEALINGVPLVLDGIDFTAQIDLSEGLNPITVSATDSYGNTGSSSISVTYKIIILESLSLEPSSIFLNTPVSTQQLTVTGTYSDGSIKDLTLATTGTTYTSGNPDIAMVSQDGLVSADTSNGTTTITATNEGISATATVELYIEITLPVVTITAPQDGVILTSSRVTVLGTIEDESPIESAFINDYPLTLDGIHFTAQVDLVEGENPITVTATDAYGNVGSDSIKITYFIEAQDTTPPLVSISYPENEVQLNQARITVTGTVQDASSILSLNVNGQESELIDSIFSQDFDLTEGTNTITATATDEFDNIGSDTITVFLDTVPPSLSVEPITSPTNKTTIIVMGSSEPGAAITISGGTSIQSGKADPISGFFSLLVSLHLNTTNILSVTATDKLGNISYPVSFIIVQDSIPPQVISITPAANETVSIQKVPCIVNFSEPIVPSTVIPGTSFQVSCKGMPMNGIMAYSPDNQTTTFIPEDFLPLESQVDILLTTDITDLAGNPMDNPFASQFFTPQEIGASVVTGEVYDDSRGLLLSGATAQLLSTNGIPSGENAPAMVTGNDGLFTLEVPPGIQKILISRDGYTSIERKIEVAADKSARLLDARLTPLDPKINQISGLSGGPATNTNKDIKIEFPQDASSSDIELRITRISPQGLRSPLPLGWSPASTVDLSANIQQLRHPATLTISVSPNLSSSGTLTAIHWDMEKGAWQVIAESVSTAGDKTITVSINRMGQYSLVIPDKAPTTPPVPVTGQSLEGATLVAYPEGISGEGIVVPAVIMVGENTQARANAKLTLPNPLPSGTLFEAQVMETFNLTSNEQLVARPFIQDLHFFAFPDDGNPSTLSAEFPVTPSRQFALGELFLGKVDLYVRQPKVTATYMVSPDGAQITTDDGLDIVIPPGCLDRNTTMQAQSVPESLFSLPVPSRLTYIGGVTIDFGGVPLSSPISITLPPIPDSIALPPDPYFVMARVEESSGIPQLFLTGLGRIVGGDRVEGIHESLGLVFRGIDSAAQYGFFLLDAPIGFINGTVYSITGQPSTNAIVTNTSLPFLARVDKTGYYNQVGQTGDIKLLAKNPLTGDQGEASVTLSSADEIIERDIFIQQTPPTIISVTPENNATGVAVTTSISVSFSEPVTGITTDTFLLKDILDTTIQGHLSIADNQMTATFYPDASLVSESTYTLYLTDGITDNAGNGLAGFASVTFTTQDLSPPVCQGDISITMPDETGYTTVIGTAGTAEPNSIVYFINNTSGMVLTISIPSSGDGSFSEQIMADISDEIMVTIVDASGNATTINPGPFKDESTGAVVVGTKGAIVRGEGGIEMNMPAGALPYATKVKIEPVDEPFELPPDIIEDPDLSQRFADNYGLIQTIKIDTGGVQFNYPVDVSIPAPPMVSPDDTFIVTQDEEIEIGGEYYNCDTDELVEYESEKVKRFKVADVATVKEIDGEMRITTASPPFPGVIGSTATAFSIVNFFVPKVAIGVVSGRVVREIRDATGNLDPNQYPVKGAVVRLLGSQVVPVYYAETDSDGKFVLSAITTMGLFEQRDITLLVTDPLSGITQMRTIAINLLADPFAKSHPEWNLGAAAVLKEEFVLISEEMIRKDLTPPNINIFFDANTLVNNIMEEGDDLNIEISVKDNRTSDPFIKEIIIDGNSTFIGIRNYYEYTEPNIQSGIYNINVTAQDDANNIASLPNDKVILVKKPGCVPGSVEGAPNLLSCDLDYIDPYLQTVNIDSSITLRFNEPIYKNTVDPNTFIVEDPNGNPLKGNYVFTINDSSITFIPSTRLRFDQQYEIKINPTTAPYKMVDTNGEEVSINPIFFTTASPEVLGGYDMKDPKDLAVKDYHAFVTDVDRSDPTGLTIIDFSDPYLGLLVGKHSLREDSYSSWGIDLDKNHAYIITVGSIISGTYTLLCTLQKWNISNPSSAFNVSWTPLTSTTTLAGVIPSTVVVSEENTFVSMLNSGFRVFNADTLSAILNADFVNPRTGSSQTSDIAVLGDYAYIANGLRDELVIVRFTDPNGLISQANQGYEVVSQVNIDPGRFVNAYRIKLAENVRVKEVSGTKYLNLALIGCLEQGLAIMDVTSPTNPEWLYTLDTPGRVVGLDVDNEKGIVVLSDSQGGLRVVDIQNLDVTDPNTLSASVCDLGSVNLGSSTKGGIALECNMVYITTQEGVKVVLLPFSCECENIKIYIEDGEHTLPVLPGETALAKAETTPPGRPVLWSIEKRDPGVKASIGSSSGIIRAEDETKSGWIKIRATDNSNKSCYKEAWIPIGCQGCDQANAQYCNKQEGSGFVGISSIDFRLNLGRAKGGQSAGELFLRADQPSSDLASPQALEFSSLAKEGVEALYDTDGSIRQIITSKSFTDIVVLNDSIYEIRFYRPDEIDDTTKKDSIYYMPISSTTPFVTWRIEKQGDTGSTGSGLRITESRGDTTKIYEYAWSEDRKTLSLSRGEGLQIQIRTEGWDNETNDRIITNTVTDSSNRIASIVQTYYHQFPWGEEIVKEVVDPDGANLITEFFYYQDLNLTGSYGKIHYQINPDGSWIRYQYDVQGRKIKDVHPWLDTPIDTPDESVHTFHYDYSPADPEDAQDPRDEHQPRTVTEKIKGVIVSKTYYAYLTNSDGDRIEIVERCGTPEALYGDPDNERTVSTFNPSGTDLAGSGRIKSIIYPDGRLDTYTYEYGSYIPDTDPSQCKFSTESGNDVRETIIHGTVEHPEGIAYKTTMETNIQDGLGSGLIQETYVYDGSEYHRIQWSVQYLDEFGRVVKVIHSDGTQTDTSWSCCAIESEKDALGIRTTYIYDDLQRVVMEIKEGADVEPWAAQNDIDTLYTYDAAGRRETETIQAGGLELVSTNSYDRAGQLLSTVDPAGLVTAYDYAQGRRITTVIRPGGSTEITTRYIDSRVKSITGTGVIPSYYDYGVNPDGSQWTKVYTGSLNSPRWEKSTVDILGRTIQIEKPGFTGIEVAEYHYNDKNQLVRTAASGQADNLYEYDELGAQIRTGLDVNHSGVLEENSNDRINESETYYTLMDDAWWQESIHRVYAMESDSTATTTGIQRTRLTGLGAEGMAAETIAVDIHGNQTITQVLIDRTNKTETRVTDYPDSTINEVSVGFNGLLVSAQDNTGIERTYSYDALGRQTGITDPRTGTTTTHYNAKGQVDYVEDPAGDRTSYVYDEQTGRRISETNALDKVIRYAYNEQGKLTHTWGDATYPVRYVYDGYGQKIQMRTFRNGSNWDAEAWPTDSTGTSDITQWHYQEATGLLAAKEDAEGRQVSYTYIVGGKLATRTWARMDGTNPLVTTYSYDPDTGELLNIDYSDSTPDITFAYDRLGRQKTITDAVGTRTFTYNDALQLEAETITGLYDKVITRTYETESVKGRSTGFSLGSEYTVTYGYDNVGRFSSVGWNVEDVSDTAHYSYLANSHLLQQLTTDNGQRTMYTYEPQRDLRTQVKNEYGTQLISQYDYTYNALGSRKSAAKIGQAFTPVTNSFNLYNYNDRNELIESARYLGSDISDTSIPVESEYRHYTYDPIGNRTEMIEAPVTHSYLTNSLNQYPEITANNGQQTTDHFTYDEDGNLTSVTDETSDVQYTYNAENRLITVAPQTPSEGDTKVEFIYDYMGRRVKKTVYTFFSDIWTLSSDILFFYDGWNMIEEQTNSNEEQTTKFFVWGLDLSHTLRGAGGIGGLLASVETSTFNNYYYLYNVNGNVGQLVDASNGLIVAHYEYDPYGKVVNSYGEMAPLSSFKFSTKYFDEETELYFYGYRYYVPSIGRWNNRDPLRETGGANLYGYVLNNPVRDYDFLGLNPIVDCIVNVTGKATLEAVKKRKVCSSIGNDLSPQNKLPCSTQCLSPEYLKDITINIPSWKKTFYNCLLGIALSSGLGKYLNKLNWELKLLVEEIISQGKTKFVDSLEKPLVEIKYTVKYKCDSKVSIRYFIDTQISVEGKPLHDPMDPLVIDHSNDKNDKELQCVNLGGWGPWRVPASNYCCMCNEKELASGM